jgi:hypothetical protein
MSVEVVGKSGSLGQFASNAGYSDLIAACKDDKILDGFFEAGCLNGKPAVAITVAALRKLKADADVQKTAAGLADMIDGQDLVVISNGT